MNEREINVREMKFLRIKSNKYFSSVSFSLGIQINIINNHKSVNCSITNPRELSNPQIANSKFSNHESRIFQIFKSRQFAIAKPLAASCEAACFP